MAGAVFHNVGQVLAAMILMPEVAPRTLLTYLAVFTASALSVLVMSRIPVIRRLVTA